jgi:hypothetical protein
MELPVETKHITFDLGRKRDAELLTKYCINPLYEDGMDFTFVDGALPCSVHGLSPMTQMWTNRVIYQAMVDTTKKRGLIISRYGGWGSHRYPGFITGEGWSQWEVYARGLEFITTSGNALMPYWTHLIGGFLGALDVEPELYVRWAQYGSFSPIAMAHGINGRRLPWEYGQAGIDTFKTYMKLRYRLIPYSYTLHRDAHEQGLPIQRPLYLEFPEDENTYRYPHQFLWGGDILAAPLTIPAAPSTTQLHSVYLPEGKWFDHDSGKVYAGKQVIHYECPSDLLPLFVRSGAIIPMQPDMAYVDEIPLDPLTVHVYAGEKGKFSLYEDDGETLAYTSGEYSRVDIETIPEDPSGRCVVSINGAKGQFRGQLASRRHRVVVHGLLKPGGVQFNGRPLPEIPLSVAEHSLTRAYIEEVNALPDRGNIQGWAWDPAEMTTTAVLPDTPTHDSIKLVLDSPGSSEDYIVAKKTQRFRDRLYKTHHMAKVKTFEFLQGYTVRTMPKLMRTIEDILDRIDKALESPKGLAQNPPDIKSFVDQIHDSIVNKPADVTREIVLEMIQLTDIADDGIRIGQQAEFSPETVNEMLNQLFDLKVFAYPRKKPDSPNWTVTVLVGHDLEATGPAEIDIQVERMLDWWTGAVSPGESDGSWTFDMGPSWVDSNAHPEAVIRGTFRWTGGEIKFSSKVKI